MARPKKTGLDYFPLDVDILSDVKVMKLIHRYGNGTALSIYIALMCRIYKEGYFIKYQEDDTAFHLSVVLHESDEEMIENVIQGCLEIGLFDREVFEQYRVLTSAAIQRRYISIQQSLRRVAKITQYKCDSIVSAEETTVSATETPKDVQKHAETAQKPEETAENATETPIKEKKGKENINSTTSSTPSSCVCARAREVDIAAETPPNVSEDKLEDEANHLRTSETWRADTKKYFNLTDDGLEDLLQRFIIHCRIITRICHRNSEDLRTHFNSWAEKELDKRRHPIKNTDYGTRAYPSSPKPVSHLDRRRSAPCPIGTTQADYE